MTTEVKARGVSRVRDTATAQRSQELEEAGRTISGACRGAKPHDTLIQACGLQAGRPSILWQVAICGPLLWLPRDRGRRPLCCVRSHGASHFTPGAASNALGPPSCGWAQ